MEKIYKDFELKKGDIVILNTGENYTFVKYDGTHAHYLDKNKKVKVGNFLYLLKKSEGVFYPKAHKVLHQ